MVNSSRLSTLLHSLFPSQCLLCHLPSERARELCVDCEAGLPWLGARCRQCALPLPRGSSDLFCGKCLSKSPAFSRCLCPLRYDFPVDRLVTGFKHHRQFANGALLAQLWLEANADQIAGHGDHCHASGMRAPDIIVPVPLHWRRRFHRGYNQSELLAKWWSNALHIPMLKAVYRHRATPSQQGLTAKQRRRNLQDAFVIPKPELIKHQHIALVDDVLTTGATAHSLAAILTRNGACQVDVWCLARTP